MAYHRGRGRLSKVNAYDALCNTFNNLYFKKASKNRFYEDHVRLRNWLLLLERDEDDPIFPSKLYEITDMLRRYIEDLPKPIQHTVVFVKDVHRKIMFLHGIASRDVKDSRRFPNSQELHLLLVRYVELEYEVLYSPQYYSAEYQKQVEKRVLSLLLIILWNSNNWQGTEMLGGNTDDQYVMSTLHIMTRVRVEYKKQQSFFENVMIKLLRMLGVLDKVTEMKSRNTFRVDQLLQVPKVQKLNEYLQSRDYGIEDSNSSEDEIDEIIEIDTPLKNELPCELEQKFDISSFACYNVQRKVMTIDLVDEDEDFSMVYFQPEVQKPSRRNKNSIFDTFIVQLAERTTSNISDKFDKYIQLNSVTTSSTCDNKVLNSESAISDDSVLVVDDDSDSDIEIVRDSNFSVVNLENDVVESSEPINDTRQSPHTQISYTEVDPDLHSATNSCELEDALLQCDDISDNEIENEDEILNKYSDDADDATIEARVNSTPYTDVPQSRFPVCAVENKKSEIVISNKKNAVSNETNSDNGQLNTSKRKFPNNNDVSSDAGVICNDSLHMETTEMHFAIVPVETQGSKIPIEFTSSPCSSDVVEIEENKSGKKNAEVPVDTNVSNEINILSENSSSICSLLTDTTSNQNTVVSQETNNTEGINDVADQFTIDTERVSNSAEAAESTVRTQTDSFESDSCNTCFDEARTITNDSNCKSLGPDDENNTTTGATISDDFVESSVETQAVSVEECFTDNVTQRDETRNIDKYQLPHLLPEDNNNVTTDAVVNNNVAQEHLSSKDPVGDEGIATKVLQQGITSNCSIHENSQISDNLEYKTSDGNSVSVERKLVDDNNCSKVQEIVQSESTLLDTSLNKDVSEVCITNKLQLQVSDNDEHLLQMEKVNPSDTPAGVNESTQDKQLEIADDHYNIQEGDTFVNVEGHRVNEDDGLLQLPHGKNNLNSDIVKTVDTENETSSKASYENQTSCEDIEEYTEEFNNTYTDHSCSNNLDVLASVAAKQEKMANAILVKQKISKKNRKKAAKFSKTSEKSKKNTRKSELAENKNTEIGVIRRVTRRTAQLNSANETPERSKYIPSTFMNLENLITPTPNRVYNLITESAIDNEESLDEPFNMNTSENQQNFIDSQLTEILAKNSVYDEDTIEDGISFVCHKKQQSNNKEVVISIPDSEKDYPGINYDILNQAEQFTEMDTVSSTKINLSVDVRNTLNFGISRNRMLVSSENSIQPTEAQPDDLPHNDHVCESKIGQEVQSEISELKIPDLTCPTRSGFYIEQVVENDEVAETICDEGEAISTNDCTVNSSEVPLIVRNSDSSNSENLDCVNSTESDELEPELKLSKVNISAETVSAILDNVSQEITFKGEDEILNHKINNNEAFNVADVTHDMRLDKTESSVNVNSSSRKDKRKTGLIKTSNLLMPVKKRQNYGKKNIIINKYEKKANTPKNADIEEMVGATKETEDAVEDQTNAVDNLKQQEEAILHNTDNVSKYNSVKQADFDGGLLKKANADLAETVVEKSLFQVPMVVTNETYRDLVSEKEQMISDAENNVLKESLAVNNTDTTEEVYGNDANDNAQKQNYVIEKDNEIGIIENFTTNNGEKPDLSSREENEDLQSISELQVQQKVLNKSNLEELELTISLSEPTKIAVSEEICDLNEKCDLDATEPGLIDCILEKSEPAVETDTNEIAEQMAIAFSESHIKNTSGEKTKSDENERIVEVSEMLSHQNLSQTESCSETVASTENEAYQDVGEYGTQLLAASENTSDVNNALSTLPLLEKIIETRHCGTCETNESNDLLVTNKEENVILNGCVVGGNQDSRTMPILEREVTINKDELIAKPAGDTELCTSNDEEFSEDNYPLLAAYEIEAITEEVVESCGNVESHKLFQSQVPEESINLEKSCETLHMKTSVGEETLENSNSYISDAYTKTAPAKSTGETSSKIVKTATNGCSEAVGSDHRDGNRRVLTKAALKAFQNPYVQLQKLPLNYEYKRKLSESLDKPKAAKISEQRSKSQDSISKRQKYDCRSSSESKHKKKHRSSDKTENLYASGLSKNESKKEKRVKRKESKLFSEKSCADCYLNRHEISTHEGSKEDILRNKGRGSSQKQKEKKAKSIEKTKILRSSSQIKIGLEHEKSKQSEIINKKKSAAGKGKYFIDNDLKLFSVDDSKITHSNKKKKQEKERAKPENITENTKICADKHRVHMKSSKKEEKAPSLLSDVKQEVVDLKTTVNEKLPSNSRSNSKNGKKSSKHSRNTVEKEELETRSKNDVSVMDSPNKKNSESESSFKRNSRRSLSVSKSADKKGNKVNQESISDYKVPKEKLQNNEGCRSEKNVSSGSSTVKLKTDKEVAFHLQSTLNKNTEMSSNIKELSDNKRHRSCRRSSKILDIVKLENKDSEDIVRQNKKPKIERNKENVFCEVSCECDSTEKQSQKKLTYTDLVESTSSSLKSNVVANQVADAENGGKKFSKNGRRESVRTNSSHDEKIKIKNNLQKNVEFQKTECSDPILEKNAPAAEIHPTELPEKCSKENVECKRLPKKRRLSEGFSRDFEIKNVKKSADEALIREDNYVETTTCKIVRSELVNRAREVENKEIVVHRKNEESVKDVQSVEHLECKILIDEEKESLEKSDSAIQTKNAATSLELIDTERSEKLSKNLDPQKTMIDKKTAELSKCEDLIETSSKKSENLIENQELTENVVIEIDNGTTLGSDDLVSASSSTLVEKAELKTQDTEEYFNCEIIIDAQNFELSQNTNNLIDTSSQDSGTMEKLDARETDCKYTSCQTVTDTKLGDGDVNDTPSNENKKFTGTLECKKKDQIEFVTVTENMKSDDNSIDTLTKKVESLTEKFQLRKKDFELSNCKTMTNTENVEMSTECDTISSELLEAKLESESKEIEHVNCNVTINTESAETIVDDGLINISNKKCDKIEKQDSKKKDPKRIDFIIENLKNRNSQKKKEVNDYDQSEEPVLGSVSETTTCLELAPPKNISSCNISIGISPEESSEESCSLADSESVGTSVQETTAATNEDHYADNVENISDISETINKTTSPAVLNTFKQIISADEELKNCEDEEEVMNNNCSFSQADEISFQTSEEVVAEKKNSDCTLIPSSVSEINDAVIDSCSLDKEDFTQRTDNSMLTNTKESETLHHCRVSKDSTLLYEIPETPELDGQHDCKTVVDASLTEKNSNEFMQVESFSPNIESLAENIDDSCTVKTTDLLPDPALALEDHFSVTENIVSKKSLRDSSENAQLPGKNSEGESQMVVDNTAVKNAINEETVENSYLVNPGPHTQETIKSINGTCSTKIENSKNDVSLISNDFSSVKENTEGSTNNNQDKNGRNCMDVVSESTSDDILSKNGMEYNYSLPNSNVPSVNDFAVAGSTSEFCVDIPVPTGETLPSKNNTLDDHCVIDNTTPSVNDFAAGADVSESVIEMIPVSTSVSHSENSAPLLDVNKQQPEVIVNLSTPNTETSTSCETTDNLIAVIFSNVALCNNTEVINDSEQNQPNKTGFIYFRGTDHNYHSVGDPLLGGECDNSESDHSSDNSKEIPTQELENVLVDDNILPYIPTLTENNLNQEPSSSLHESPVDGSTDFQLLEQCLIGNTLGRESSPPLPQSCDTLYQTNLKQEVLEYDDNSTNSNMDFSHESSEVYINQFQQQTMSVENMSELMNAVLTRIQNLNNMTRPSQHYDSTSKDNIFPPVAAEFNISTENIQTTQTNSVNMTSHNLESDCNFVPTQEISNSYMHPESSNVEYSNISFGNGIIPETVSFETDFTNFYYLPVAHDTSYNNSCNKKVIVERIPQYSDQPIKSFVEISNPTNASTATTTIASKGVATNINVKSASLPKHSELTSAHKNPSVNSIPEVTSTLKSNHLSSDKVKQNESNNDLVPTSTTINVGFVRTSSRTRVSAPRPKKPSDSKSVDTKDSENHLNEETETDLTFDSASKIDNCFLKLKVRDDLGIPNASLGSSSRSVNQDYRSIPAKERSLCIIEDSNGLDTKQQNTRFLIQGICSTNNYNSGVQKSSNKQPKENEVSKTESLVKLNAKTEKLPKEDAACIEDVNKLNARKQSSKPHKEANASNIDQSHTAKNQNSELVKEGNYCERVAKLQRTEVITRPNGTDNITAQTKAIEKSPEKINNLSDMIDNVKRRKRKPVDYIEQADYIERVDYSSIEKLLGHERDGARTTQRVRQKKEETEDISSRPKKRKQEVLDVKQLKTKIKICRPSVESERNKLDAVSACSLSDVESDIAVKPSTSIFEDSDDDIPKKKKSKPEVRLEPDTMNDLFDRLVKEGNINNIKNSNMTKPNKDTDSLSVCEGSKQDGQKLSKSTGDPSNTSNTRAITSTIFNLEAGLHKKPDAVTPVKQIGVVNPIPRPSNIVRKEPPCSRNNYSSNEENRNSSQYYPYYSDRNRRSYPYSNRESSRSSHQGSSRRIEYQPHSSDQRYSSSQRSSGSGRSSRSSRHHSNSWSSAEQRSYRYSSPANDLAWREDMKKKFPNMFKDEVYF